MQQHMKEQAAHEATRWLQAYLTQSGRCMFESVRTSAPSRCRVLLGKVPCTGCQSIRGFKEHWLFTTSITAKHANNLQ